jgi:hypothetical protein
MVVHISVGVVLVAIAPCVLVRHSFPFASRQDQVALGSERRGRFERPDDEAEAA